MLNLERWMRDLFSKLQEEKRWGSLPASYNESVLEHSMKMAFLMQVLIAIEEWYGNVHNLNGYALLQCAINHDFAESVMGDIAYPDKNGDDDEEEITVFERLMKEAVHSDIVNYFPVPFNLNPSISEKHRKFWEAAEHIGYCLFALEEGEAFRPVTKKSLDILETMLEFDSVLEFYERIKEKYDETNEVG